MDRKLNNSVVLFVPHSQTDFPSEFWNERLMLTRQQIKALSNRMSDVFTDDLFSARLFTSVIAPYSRIFCDLERFLDDEKELMSIYGMGAVYYKTDFGKRFIEYSEDYKNRVIENYYKKMHMELDLVVNKELEKNKTVILIDCHSFDKNEIMDKTKRANLPDFCIGYNEEYFSDKTINFVKNFLEKAGYSVQYNYPFSGAMIPNTLFGKNKKGFYSFMIEINRDLFLKRKIYKNENYTKIKEIINRLLLSLKEFDNAD